MVPGGSARVARPHTRSHHPTPAAPPHTIAWANAQPTNAPRPMPGDPLAAPPVPEQLPERRRDTLTPMGGLVHPRPGSSAHIVVPPADVARHHPRDQMTTAPQQATDASRVTSAMFRARDGHVMDARPMVTTGSQAAIQVHPAPTTTGSQAAIQLTQSSASRIVVLDEGDQTPEATRRYLERVRADHASAEAGVRALGTVYWLGGVALALVTGASLALPSLLAGTPLGGLAAYGTLTGVACALGLALAVAGERLRALNPAARSVSLALSAVAMLAFPVGTLLGGYGLVLLLSERGAFVLSDEHRVARAQTKDTPLPAAWGIWGCVAASVLIVAAALQLGWV